MFYLGSKFHSICMEKGEQLNSMIRLVAVDDGKPLEYKAEYIFSKLVGVKGYISRNLFKRQFIKGIQFIIKLMKGAIMKVSDKFLLQKKQ